MSTSEYLEVKNMINNIIALIKWKGASLENKQNKIIKELSMVKQFCFNCLNKSD